MHFRCISGLKAHLRPSTISLNPPNFVPEIIDSVCLPVSSRTRAWGEVSEPGIWGWGELYLMFDVIWMTKSCDWFARVCEGFGPQLVGRVYAVQFHRLSSKFGQNLMGCMV